MRQIPKYDKLRFRHEYEGVAIKDLCAEYGYIIDDFQKYAEEHKWEQVTLALPASDDPSDPMYKEYTTARRKLTIAAIRRAMSIWHRVQTLEDDILNIAESSINSLANSLVQGQENAAMMPMNIGLEISRLAKVIESVTTNNKMFTEALEVAALKDSDREGLDDVDLTVRVTRRFVDPKKGDTNEQGDQGGEASEETETGRTGEGAEEDEGWEDSV